MNIAVIGTGYVGLVTGTCFAESGHTVLCVDTDKEKIAKLERGEMPIYEPGLDEIVHRNVHAHRLSFTDDTARAVAGAEVVFLAVGTPSREDGSADLSYLMSAAERVARAITGPCVLVTKSTVPVGTSRKLWNLVQQHTTHTFSVVSNPEFLKEGDAINDFMRPDRVIVGCESEDARAVMRDIYEPFVRTENPILFMDLESAEMTKYAANAFLATKISFMNEMATLAADLGADIDLVRKGVGFDRRIGHLFMFPGVGYGGSCFPKDVRELVSMGRKREAPLRILEAVDAVNECQKSALLHLLGEALGPDLKDKKITLWGLSFKPRTDDIREAPALVVIDALLAAGAQVTVNDPVALANGRKHYQGKPVVFAEEAYASVEGADALLLVTEWSEFRRPDFVRITGLMRTPVILDGRNIWDPKALRGLGFTYRGIGRR